MLDWCEGAEQITCGMKIIDISGWGAAVLADQRPTVNQPVRIRLASGALGSESVEARVVSTSADPSGKQTVRMKFTSWHSLGTVLEQHEEHRHWQRYPALGTRASLVWFNQDGEHTVACTLLNISGGGAALYTDTTVPDQHPLLLSLQVELATSTPVECRLVAASIDVSGSKLTRVRFVEPCPVDLFELAVHGRSNSPWHCRRLPWAHGSTVERPIGSQGVALNARQLVKPLLRQIKQDHELGAQKVPPSPVPWTSTRPPLPSRTTLRSTWAVESSR